MVYALFIVLVVVIAASLVRWFLHTALSLVGTAVLIWVVWVLIPQSHSALLWAWGMLVAALGLVFGLARQLIARG